MASSLEIPNNSILTFQKREKDSLRNIHIDVNAFENPLTFTSQFVFFPDHRGAREGQNYTYAIYGMLIAKNQMQ